MDERGWNLAEKMNGSWDGEVGVHRKSCPKSKKRNRVTNVGIGGGGIWEGGVSFEFELAIHNKMTWR